MQKMSQDRRSRRYGSRKWLTEIEIANKYGSTEIAAQIVRAKLEDKEARLTQVRKHPDLGKDDPDIPDTWRTLF